MSSPALRVNPQVNLDEFERRLRAATATPSAPEDPLTELARLVGMENAPQRSAENIVALASRAQSADASGVSAHEPLIRISYATASPAVIDPPQLRSTFFETATHADELAIHAAGGGETIALEPARDESLLVETVVAQAADRRRGGRWFATVSTLSLLGVLGIGSAVALKYGAIPSLHKAPPVIMASVTPTKVAPPSVDTVAPPNDTASVLFRDQSAKPAPVKVVSNEEQPVDLRSQPVASPAVPVAPAALPSAAPPTPQAISPIAPNPSTPIVAVAETGASGEGSVGSPLFAEPKKVKTVSVRPDGTLITKIPAPTANAAPAARSIAALPLPTTTMEAPVDSATAQPATPKIDLPAKPRAKLTARVQPGKVDATTAASADAPLQLTPPTKLEKAAKAARAKSTATAIAALSATPAVASPADPTPTATTTDPTASLATGGNYAVQLAAPTSDQEAQSAATRLKAKYSTELNGLEPTIHKADVSSGTVYRVRVGSLSKADAVALCEKLKASGGACFVARN